MKIELIVMHENEDGSATAELDIDEEGKMYLMQLGLEVIIMRGLDAIKDNSEWKP